jgi:hypothetical protein
VRENEKPVDIAVVAVASDNALSAVSREREKKTVKAISNWKKKIVKSTVYMLFSGMT